MALGTCHHFFWKPLASQAVPSWVSSCSLTPLSTSFLGFLPLPASSCWCHTASAFGPLLSLLCCFSLLHALSGWYKYSCGFDSCPFADNSSIYIFSRGLFSEYQTYSESFEMDSSALMPHGNLILIFSKSEFRDRFLCKSAPLPHCPQWMAGAAISRGPRQGWGWHPSLLPLSCRSHPVAMKSCWSCSLWLWNLIPWLPTATALLQYFRISPLNQGNTHFSFVSFKLLLVVVLVLLLLPALSSCCYYYYYYFAPIQLSGRPR